MPSNHTFFGLTPEYDQTMMDQIFDLSYYSNGGLTFEQIYNMPVNVRSYYYMKLLRTKEAEAKAAEEQQQKNNRGR